MAGIVPEKALPTNAKKAMDLGRTAGRTAIGTIVVIVGVGLGLMGLGWVATKYPKAAGVIQSGMSLLPGGNAGAAAPQQDAYGTVVG